jgi:hypothetical protein
MPPLLDFSLKPEFAHGLQHFCWGCLAGVKPDIEQFTIEIHRHRFDTRKPCQGFFDPVGSGHSGELRPFVAAAHFHFRDVQGNRFRSGGTCASIL